MVNLNPSYVLGYCTLSLHFLCGPILAAICWNVLQDGMLAAQPQLLTKAPSPIWLGSLLNLLALYSPNVDALCLADGFSQVFRMHCKGECKQTYAKNLKSVAVCRT